MKEKTIVAVGVLVLFIIVGAVGTAIASSPFGGAGSNVEQTEGEVKITVVTPGNRDSMQLVAPSGTRSLVMPGESTVAGSRMTLRSNETVYEFFEENNVTIPTTTEKGFVNITSPEDVPLQDLIFQDDDLTQDTSYNRRSAYLACLYDPYRGFEVDGTVVPQNVSIPCHDPVLAQFDEIQAGTSKEIGNVTVTTPLILEEGEYKLFGSVDGDCAMFTWSISVSSTVALGESLGDGPGTCAQSEIGGKSLPDSAYLIALVVVAVGVAAVAYKRF